MVIAITNENTDIINKYTKVEKNYLETADKLLEGNLKLLKGLDPITFEKVPDWNYKHNISSNTYQLYLHTLNFTKSLVKSYIFHNDFKYISLAKKIIDDWIEKNLDQEKKSNYVWYDHTVSSRIQNILFYQVNVPAYFKIEENLLSKVFEKHIEFLSRYKNYTENNHGIMMDRALLISALFYKDEEVRKESLMLSKNRIEKAILRDYSYNSTHLENSPDYHRMVTNWLNGIVMIFDEIKLPLSNKYKTKLKNAVDYNGIISNYNNEYPMIGDTSHGISKIQKKDIDFIDYEAGVGIFNDKTTKSTFVFNCGFENLTHKHYDDLSIILSVNKEQIFVDAGKYNYSKKDPIRQYFLSPKAHTTLFVQNESYSLGYDRVIKIDSSYVCKDYKIIKGVHHGYDDTSLTRTIVSLGEDIYILIDEATSTNAKIYVQNFVLHNDVTLSNNGIRKYSLETLNNKKYILQEHSKIATSKIFRGQKSNAMLSKKFNQVEDTVRLEIRKKQRNTSFLTTFTPENISIDEIKVDSGILIINIDGEIRKISLL